MISQMLLVLVISLLTESYGTEYIVGDSFWSIPTTNHFYNHWSSSHFFQTGDSLSDFDFDSGLHNVMQVSVREYESCSADHPFDAFRDGPARIVFMEQGVFYFVCSVANYCALGQKLIVVVHRRENNSSNSSPGPSSDHHSHPFSSSSSEPDRSPTTYSSESPDGNTNWSISAAEGPRSGGDQCYHGVLLPWFAASFIAFYFIC